MKSSIRPCTLNVCPLGERCTGWTRWTERGREHYRPPDTMPSSPSPLAPLSGLDRVGPGYYTPRPAGSTPAGSTDVSSRAA